MAIGCKVEDISKDNPNSVMVEIHPGDKIIRGNIVEYLNSTVPSQEGPYVKVYSGPLQLLAKTLTGAELKLLVHLLPHINYEHGMLVKFGGNPLTREDIASSAQLSMANVDKILGKLKKDQIIGVHTTGRSVQYFVNPWLFMRGRRVNKTLHAMFAKTRWAMIEK